MSLESSFFGKLEPKNSAISDLFKAIPASVSVSGPASSVVARPKETGKDEKLKDEKFQDSKKKEKSDSLKKSNVSEPKSSNENLTRKQKIENLIEKNDRTLFVGNVCLQVVEKQNTKMFKKMFQEFGELESIRFRSLAFSEKLPRKQAFIAKKFHEGRDSLNAYVVFKASQDAKKALALNGSVFMDLHIRVDHSEQKQEKKRDSKRCVFVGNLPFNVSDEALWAFFTDAGDIEYVRIIRDRKTNVGKGFGYVQFKERSDVALALKCDGGFIGTRAIRVSRASESLAQVFKKNSTKQDGKEKAVVEGVRASRPDPAKKIRVRSAVSKKKKGKK